MWEQVEAPLVLSVLLHSFCDVGDGETVVQEPLFKRKSRSSSVENSVCVALMPTNKAGGGTAVAVIAVLVDHSKTYLLNVRLLPSRMRISEQCRVEICRLVQAFACVCLFLIFRNSQDSQPSQVAPSHPTSR